MQSVSSRIWTRVAVSISYDDNYYTTGTFVLDYNTWNHLIVYIFMSNGSFKNVTYICWYI